MLSQLWRIADRYGSGFFAYFAIAIVSAIVELGSFAAALYIVAPVSASLIAFVFATTANFVLSRRFVFNSTHPIFRDFLLVLVASSSVFIWNIAIFYALYAFFDFGLMTAKVIGTAFGFLANYAARQFLVFSAKPRLAPLSVLLKRDRS
jgi:putative flippase GtrA